MSSKFQNLLLPNSKAFYNPRLMADEFYSWPKRTCRVCRTASGTEVGAEIQLPEYLFQLRQKAAVIERWVGLGLLAIEVSSCADEFGSSH